MARTARLTAWPRVAVASITRALSHGYIWLVMYFVANLFLTLHNKYVMAIYKFSFPYTLTGIHAICALLGSLACARMRVFEPVQVPQRGVWTIAAFSVLYTVNIAVSNVSLNLVSVPVHQTVRATTPLFAIVLGWTMSGKKYSKEVIASQLPMIIGVAMATAGDYSYTSAGLLLTLLGAAMAALKGVVTNMVLVGPLKLHPLDLLQRMSALAVLQCAVYALVAGEVHGIAQYVAAGKMSPIVALSLAGNGAIAFLLNYVSFTANKKTSALTICVAANVKQVLSIVIAVFLFSLKVTLFNGLGIGITLAGGALYSYLELRSKTAAAKRSTPSSEIREHGSALEGVAGSGPDGRGSYLPIAMPMESVQQQDNKRAQLPLLTRDSRIEV